MAKTTVVSMRHDIYDIRIDRRSIFGNMFKVGPDGTREEVVAKYRVWFHKQIENDPAFKGAVLRLKGLRLGCWCAPLKCHGQVIADYLESVE